MVSPSTPKIDGQSPVTRRTSSKIASNTLEASPCQQHWIHVNRVYVAHDHAIQRHLDDQVADQEARDVAALAQAAAEHDRIRRNAEIARERVELEIERERTRREIDEVNRLEAERRAKAHTEIEEQNRIQRQLEMQERELHLRSIRQKELQEAEARMIEARRKREADTARAQKENDEAAVKAKEKARLAVEHAAKARAHTHTQPVEPVQVQSQAPTSRISVSHHDWVMLSSTAERETQHRRYLELHQKLKVMRNHVVTESKKIPSLKSKLGDWRRQITKCLGQLTQDKVRNRKPLLDIQTVLKESLQYNEPAVDVTSYILSRSIPPPTQSLIASGPFIYLVNIIAKSVILQFVGECSGGAKAIDPIGVVAITIFAMPAFLVQQRPVIDILLAKFHQACPILFGISGDESTVPGRVRSGWLRDKGTGRFIEEERHRERMAGLASGYAALSLRDFGKSKNANPLPNSHYWAAFAMIVNTPTDKIQPTHYTVLRALIMGFVPRFIAFYGTAAVAALKSAIIDFPNRAPSASKTNATQLAVTKELLYNEYRFSLS